MATSLRKNGPIDKQHIKNNRRNLYCTTHPNTHKPNKEAIFLENYKNYGKKNYQHTTSLEKPSKLPPKISIGEFIPLSQTYKITHTQQYQTHQMTHYLLTNG
jgi:hypothetical protein